MRRWWLLLVGCLAAAVAVPLIWTATRPSADEGVPVTSVGAPARASSTLPALPTLSTRPATPGSDASDPAPVHLGIPSAGIDAGVTPVGVDANGAMVVPEAVREVGWYRFGPAPGAAAGAAVIAGHVDARIQGAGALFALRTVGVGDRVTVTLDGGRTLTYRVAGKQTITKQRLPVERLFARDGAPRLVLITCGGPFIAELGSYQDNLVVVAVPAQGSA